MHSFNGRPSMLGFLLGRTSTGLVAIWNRKRLALSHCERCEERSRLESRVDRMVGGPSFTESRSFLLSGKLWGVMVGGMGLRGAHAWVGWGGVGWDAMRWGRTRRGQVGFQLLPPLLIKLSQSFALEFEGDA